MIARPGDINGTSRRDAASAADLEANAAHDQAGGSADASYDELAGWLQNEAERLFTHGQYGPAEQRVRQLLEVQSQVVGQQHADFALGLSMLGELRFLQGDRDGAESLFRHALTIRERVLGRSHPDFAVSLTCLAAVLWRRDALDDAEQCLRDALAIRSETLGPSDPETIQGRKELVRLLRQRGRWAEAQELVQHYRSHAGVEVWNSTAAGGPVRDLPAEVVVLSSQFAKLGATLASAARAMATVGAPPESAVVREMDECRRRFESLRGETLERIATLQAPNPPDIEVGSLDELATVLDELSDAELLQREQEQLRQRALAVLDRVVALRCRGRDNFGPLRECQTHAEQLRGTIRSGHWMSLPAQTESLAEGTHALVSLLILVEELEELTDQEWADLHELVSDSLGKSLATAASQARLTVNGRSTRTAAPIPGLAPNLSPAASRPPPASALSIPPAAPIAAVTDHTPSMGSGLLRELAMASLVPTMGTVINLPSASPTETLAHRLLRNGYAPNVVERQVVAAQASHGGATGQGSEPSSHPRRRQGIATTINAGPLALLQGFGTALEPRSRLGSNPIQTGPFETR